MLAHPDRYWLVLMTVTQAQRDDFEAECDQLIKKLQDARDSKFLAVFPPDILANGQHLVFLMIAREPVRDPSTSYRGRFFGKSRRVVVALTPNELHSMDSKLAGLMSERERVEYQRLKRTPHAPLIAKPMPDSFAVCAILGIYPE
jgi:hypothetical protein